MRRFVLCVLLLLAGCASNPIVTVDPPPARADDPPARPGGDMEWHSGHYAFDDSKGIYYWVEGTWEAAREGYLWFPGEWEPVEDGDKRLGWRWVDERWERIDMLEALPPSIR